MKTISVNKLKPFMLIDEETRELFKPLYNIQTVDKFSIASDGNRAGILYNTPDHDLNYTFGNCFDMVTSLFKQLQHFTNDNITYSFIINSKEVLTAIKEQYKALQVLVKDSTKETIKTYKMITIIEIDSVTNTLCLSTRTVEKFNLYPLTISDQPELYTDFQQLKNLKMETYTASFNTKYLIDFLEFFTGYEQITIHTVGHRVNPIRCETEDRESVLMPIVIS